MFIVPPRKTNTIRCNCNISSQPSTNISSSLTPPLPAPNKPAILLLVRKPQTSHFLYKQTGHRKGFQGGPNMNSASCCGPKLPLKMAPFTAISPCHYAPSSSRPRPTRRPVCCSASNPSSTDPLLVKAARGEPVDRPPAWMMRQAGRYMAVYRKLAEKYPSFRERSETTDLIVEISLQPWNAFRPDGVIIFSDILTPLPAFGVPFDIEEVRGPVIQSPIQSEEGLKALHPIELDKLDFVADSLKILRREVEGKAAVLGFVGAPWTIATYIVEGGTTRTYSTIKSMCHTAPKVLRALLSHLTQAISEYIVFQVESGAHCIQIFDSWGGQLPPHMWESWSKPYIEEIVSTVRSRCPLTPLVLYINGNGGLLERMKGTGVDVIGLDWTVDMAEGRKRLGSGISVQGNADPACLFSPLPVVADEIHRVVKCAGPRGHILNLGHGVLVGTPEEAVSHFFEVARSLKFDVPFQDQEVEAPNLLV